MSGSRSITPQDPACLYPAGRQAGVRSSEGRFAAGCRTGNGGVIWFDRLWVPRRQPFGQQGKKGYDLWNRPALETVVPEPEPKERKA
ncbi:MAG: hypothetical protein Kow001_20320 [Acidobacteriota bacterium]